METENAAAAAAAAFTASSQLKEAVLGRRLWAVFPKGTGFQARDEPGPSGGQASGPPGLACGVPAFSYGGPRFAALSIVAVVSGSGNPSCLASKASELGTAWTGFSGSTQVGLDSMSSGGRLAGDSLMCFC